MSTPEPQFDPDLADDDGLVAIGGDLDTATLLRAYRSGVFPWYSEGYPVLWWSPDPRAVIELPSGLHVSRRLARTLRSGRFSTSVNRDFAGVIRGCADRPPDETWLMPEMIAAYERLHEYGHAHSVEVWRDGALVGGVYGVAAGGLFAAESMFHYETDASKVALAALVERLNARGFMLLDVQIINDHTARMGATEVPREMYLGRLGRALAMDRRFDRV